MSFPNGILITTQGGNPDRVISAPALIPFNILIEPNTSFEIVASLSGPSGGGGSSGAKIVVVATDSLIVSDQIYTVVNSVADTLQTLPDISTVLLNGLGTPFVINNYSAHRTTIQGSGGDLVQHSASAILTKAGQSLTLLPTPLGWLII